MIFVTRYSFKPFLTKPELKAIMDAFAEVGTAPGTTAHYVNADGGGGLLISESDDAAEGYRNLRNYVEWMEFDTKVMLPVEVAVPIVLESLA